MKKFSKLFMVVACLAMVFCFSAGAFASVDTADSVDVTIYLQTADRGENTATLPTDVQALGSISVSASASDTLYDVINKATALAPVDWKIVDILDPDTWEVAEKDGGRVLESLTFNGKEYANETKESTAHYYKGVAWTYFYGTPENMPADFYNYPSSYLNKVTVSDLANYGNAFTLSYETTAMSF